MTNAGYYDVGAFEALEIVEDRRTYENRNETFYDDVMKAESILGRELAGMLRFLTKRQRGLMKLRKTCLFDYEQQELWSALRSAAKAFDDAFEN